MEVSKRLLILLIVPALLVAGVVGHAASTLTPNAVLLNNAPCTVTLSGQPYNGTCSGAFVDSGSPLPTPTPTPTFNVVQTNKVFLTMLATFTPTLARASQAGSSIVLLASSAADGNTAYTPPAGWQRVADVTDGNPAGLHMFYYPNAPAGTTFGAFTLSAATDVSYVIAEVGATLTLDATGTSSSGATAVSTLATGASAATANPAEIVFAGFGASQGAARQTWGAPSGFTLINREDSNTVDESILSDQVVSTSATYAASEAMTTPAWGKGIIATFSAAPTVVPSVSPTTARASIGARCSNA